MLNDQCNLRNTIQNYSEIKDLNQDYVIVEKVELQKLLEAKKWFDESKLTSPQNLNLRRYLEDASFMSDHKNKNDT